MSNKKVSEMTFKEFSEEVKKRGANRVIDDPSGITNILLREGFSNEQLNEMKMDKIWKLYIDSVDVLFDQTFNALGVALAKDPQAVLALQPYLENLKEEFEKLLEELENQENGMEDNP